MAVYFFPGDDALALRLGVTACATGGVAEMRLVEKPAFILQPA
jgi:hypothetical protein